MKAFSTNSRFAVLSEDFVSENTSEKSKQNDRNKMKVQRNETQRNEIKNSFSSFKKDTTFQVEFAEFPELVIKKDKKSVNQPNQNSFLSKLKTGKRPDTVKLEEELEPGWMKIQRDPQSYEIKITYGEGYIEPLLLEEKEQDHQDITTTIMTTLSKIHRKRTEEYIELWGKDDWETKFLFENSCYNYEDYSEEEVECVEEIYDYDTEES